MASTDGQKRPCHGAVTRFEPASVRNSARASRVVAVLQAPLGEKVGELIVDLVGKHDVHRYELVARAAVGAVVHALAFEPKYASRAGALRDGDLDATRDGWHLDLGADHGFIERDRQLEGDIVARALELLMRTHTHFDQRIAGLTTAAGGPALAAQAQDLTVGHALGHVEIKHAAFGHGDALGSPVDGLQKIYLQRIANVLPAHAERRAGIGAATPTHGAKQVGENIAKTELVAGARAPRVTAERVAAGVSALIAAALLTIGVDLAPVVLLALFGVADDLIGGRDLLEAFLGRGSVAGVEVGVQLLGQFAIGPADLFVGCRARHA